MTPVTISVVVPVKDGERYLDELFGALAREGGDLEVVIIDSGSRDRSVAIARSAGGLPDVSHTIATCANERVSAADI